MTGQQWIFNHYTPVSQTSGYDGDGNKVKDETGAGTTFYLKSSALAGALVAEVSSSGQKNVGYVYAPGGVLLAEQQSNAVTWRHVTPAGTGRYDTYSNSSSISRLELDPLGADINLTGPPTPDTGGGDGDVGTNHFGGLMSRLTSDFFNTANDCVVNGSRESCSVAMFYINTGSGSRGKDFTEDSSVTMDDLGKSLGVVFTPAGISANSLMSAGLNGSAGFSTYVMGWAEDPETGIKYWVPIPTAYSGTSASAGSVGMMVTSIRLQEPTIAPLRLTDQNKELRLKHSFSDARNVLTTKGTNAKWKAAVKKCLDFFTQGSSLDEVVNILDNFGATASYDPALNRTTAQTANSGRKMAASVRLGDPFFADDNIGIKGTGLNWDQNYQIYVTMQNLTPRQNRALSILHEFAHALGLLPHDSREVDPTGKISAQNDAAIYEKCGDVIDAIVPWRD